MGNLPFALAAVLVVAAAPLAAEEQAESLTGEFYAQPADPEAGSPPMLYVTVSGEAAKELYEGLAAAAQDNECIGGKTKFLADGSGYCHYDEAEGADYFCSFSIDLQAGRFAGGETC